MLRVMVGDVLCWCDVREFENGKMQNGVLVMWWDIVFVV